MQSAWYYLHMKDTYESRGGSQGEFGIFLFLFLIIERACSIHATGDGKPPRID
jgi:hypothetical protein